ncbi:hypothetical protein BB561_004167 [Smittium simulii]|uniref:Uncharacterized protein n=1 Tax=Smittium simulii TaxID=133385 RepID=A0A2T9YHU0_9FUNG|nr:hypothetical protein BB561_004167 [Smittium simulii]
MKITSIIGGFVSLLMAVKGLDVAGNSLSTSEMSSFPKSTDEFGDENKAIQYKKQTLAINSGDLVPIEFKFNRSENFSPKDFYVGLYGTEDKRFVRSLGKIGSANVERLSKDGYEYRFYVNFQDGGNQMRVYNIALFCTDSKDNFSYTGKGLVSYLPK